MAADVYLGVISVQMWLTSHRQDEITQGGSVGGPLRSSTTKMVGVEEESAEKTERE